MWQDQGPNTDIGNCQRGIKTSGANAKEQIVGERIFIFFSKQHLRLYSKENEMSISVLIPI